MRGSDGNRPSQDWDTNFHQSHFIKLFKELDRFLTVIFIQIDNQISEGMLLCNLSTFIVKHVYTKLSLFKYMYV